MARAKVLSPATENKIRAWKRFSGVSILNQNVVNALTQLETDGCDSETLLLVLELSRIYPSGGISGIRVKQSRTKQKKHLLGTALRLKTELEDAETRVKTLADDLMRDAKAIDREAFNPPAPLASLALSKNMTIFADWLDYVAKHTNFVVRNGLFGRELGGLGLTLWAAVYAAELIRRETKRKSPHYSELVEIFSAMLNNTDPEATMSVESFSRNINRFRKRNPNFISKNISLPRLKTKVRDLVEEWKEAESALKHASRVGGSKSDSSVHSSKVKVQEVRSSSPRHT
jgi:hypothetical protein